MAEILKGVRILDLSQSIAGPYGTLVLGDLGAEIIKIENPERGDLSRNLRQYTHKGERAYYLSLNRNKKSLTLNFRNPKARETFYELVKISDVVYDNFRSGMLERFKVDYESLVAKIGVPSRSGSQGASLGILRRCFLCGWGGNKQPRLPRRKKT